MFVGMLDHVRGQFPAFFSTVQFPVRLRLDRSLTISVALATMNNNFVARSFASFAKHFFMNWFLLVLILGKCCTTDLYNQLVSKHL